MRRIKILCIGALMLLAVHFSFAQPYTDVISTNNYFARFQYNDSAKTKGSTQNYYGSLLIPKKIGTQTIFMVRLNGEKLVTEREGRNPYILYSASVPIALQRTTKSEKWKLYATVIPKINSDFRDNIKNDFQLGGAFLATRVINPNLSLKLGAYYMQEFFGPFYFPLVGADWKINKKWRLYGVLPSFYRLEFIPFNKIYTGLGYRMNQRSFRLESKFNNDYVRVLDNQVNWFVEGFVLNKILIGFQVFKSVTNSMLRYDYIHRDLEKSGIPQFSSMNTGWGINFNFSYRIRTD